MFIYLLAARGSFIRKLAFLNRTYQYFIFYVVIIDSAFINKEGLSAWAFQLLSFEFLSRNVIGQWHLTAPSLIEHVIYKLLSSPDSSPPYPSSAFLQFKGRVSTLFRTKMAKELKNIHSILFYRQKLGLEIYKFTGKSIFKRLQLLVNCLLQPPASCCWITQVWNSCMQNKPGRRFRRR